MTQAQVSADAPDSLRGWLAALSDFIAGFVVFGVMYSFGVFFTPMEAEFHASRTATSVFFAITGMLFYFFGSIASRLSDRPGLRRIVLAGGYHGSRAGAYGGTPTDAPLCHTVENVCGTASYSCINASSGLQLFIRALVRFHAQRS